MRPLGQITDELEPLLYELVEDQEMQAHEVLHMVYGWIQCHYPDAIENYEDGTHPQFFYGTKEYK